MDTNSFGLFLLLINEDFLTTDYADCSDEKEMTPRSVAAATYGAASETRMSNDEKNDKSLERQLIASGPPL